MRKISDARETWPAADYHVRAIEDVVAELRTDPESGLRSDEAALRAERFGPNELRPSRATPAWRLLLSQFNDFMIWVLFAAVAISAFEGQVLEALAITAILVLNGVLGFVQEFRAERALAALKEMSAPEAAVVRDGREMDVPATELVPGDVILLKSGDRVPADSRLIEVAVLRVDEASLTGESRPASKVVEPIEDPEAALGDRLNTVFAGTSVAVGRARAVVTATGQSTEMGKIADLLAAQEDVQTPLQEELKRVGKIIAVMVLTIAAIVFGVEVWRSLAGSGLTLAAALRSPGARAASVATRRVSGSDRSTACFRSAN